MVPLPTRLELINALRRTQRGSPRIVADEAKFSVANGAAFLAAGICLPGFVAHFRLHWVSLVWRRLEHQRRRTSHMRQCRPRDRSGLRGRVPYKDTGCRFDSHAASKAATWSKVQLPADAGLSYSGDLGSLFLVGKKELPQIGSSRLAAT